MKYIPIHPIETPRLILRRLRREDAQRYYDHLGSSAAVCRGMTFNPHPDISLSVASVEKTLARYETGRCYRWCITRKDDDRLIGVIDLLAFDEEADTCSFAYMLGEAWWGRGYGTEAAAAAFRFAFEELGIQTIDVDHFAHNPASGRVMEKLGMTRLGVVNGKYEKNGEKLDAVQYILHKKDWHFA